MAPRMAAGNGNDSRRKSNSRAALNDMQLLDIPEAAGVLDCSRSKIYLMLTQGELGSVKIGRLRKIPIAEIRRITSTRHRPRQHLGKLHMIEDAELDRIIAAKRRRRRQSQPPAPD
jgi:excisionase family DNA binding protein